MKRKKDGGVIEDLTLGEVEGEKDVEKGREMGEKRGDGEEEEELGVSCCGSWPRSTSSEPGVMEWDKDYYESESGWDEEVWGKCDETESAAPELEDDEENSEVEDEADVAEDLMEDEG